MHGCKWRIFAVGEDIGCSHCFDTIGFVLLEVHFSNEFSEFGFSSLGLSTDGEVTERFHSVFVLCHGLAHSLRHFLEVGLCLFVIKQWAEGQLFSDVLCIICDAILSSHHVEEVIKRQLHTHPHVVEGQAAHFSLDIVRHEFRFNGGLDGFRGIFAIASRVHGLKHVLNSLLNRLGVLVEQLEWSGGVSIATHIGKGIFDVDFTTALPDGIPYCNEGEREQDDHVQRLAT